MPARPTSRKAALPSKRRSKPRRLNTLLLRLTDSEMDTLTEKAFVAKKPRAVFIREAALAA